MQQMNFNLGVDTGTIGVYDQQFITENRGIYGETAERMSRKVPVEPGMYNVTLSLCGYHGNVTKTNQVVSPSGVLIFGDICYCFNSEEYDHIDRSRWSDFLKLTNYLDTDMLGGFSIGTGGDGEFTVHVTIEKV